MASGWVSVHSTYNVYYHSRGPYLHKNNGQTGDEHLFFCSLGQDTGTAVYVLLHYSDDYGDTWTTVTAATLNNTSITHCDLAWDVGANRLHLLWLDSDGSSTSSVGARRYNMDTLAWAASAETVHSTYTTADGGNPYAIMMATARTSIDSSGNGMVALYRGPRYRTMGQDYETAYCAYKRSGSWTTTEVSPTTTQLDYYACVASRGTSDKAHFVTAYASATYRRTLLTGDTLTGNGSDGTFSTNGASSFANQVAGSTRAIVETHAYSSTEYMNVGDRTGSTARGRRYNESGSSIVLNTINDFPSSPNNQDKTARMVLGDDATTIYAISRDTRSTVKYIEVFESTDGGDTWSHHGTADDDNTTAVLMVGTGPGPHTYIRGDNGDEMLGYVDRSSSAVYFGDYLIETGANTVQITHTTDARVGVFVDHTTDAVISEFPGPTNTTMGVYAGSRGHRIGITGGKLYMLGTDNTSQPDTIKLWIGTQAGEGFWELKEFTHGTGTNMLIRDVAMAIVNGIVHIVYIHHNFGGGGLESAYHIEYNPGTGNFTDNGAFGSTDSHSDVNASIFATCDVVATADNELIAYTRTLSYVSFGGSNTYRASKRVYKSSTQAFSGTGDLVAQWWGPDAFTRPSVAVPQLNPSGNNAYLMQTGGFSYWNGTSESDRIANRANEGPSTWYEQNARNDFYEDWWLNVSGDVQRLVGVGGTAGLVGLGSGLDDQDPLVFDKNLGFFVEDLQSHFLFEDHYGRVGVYLYNATDDEGTVYVYNGVDGYNSYTHAYTPTDSPSIWYVAPQLLDRHLVAWHYNVSTAWVDLSFEIPAWHIAHTTDTVIVNNGKNVAYHTTDALIVSGAYGLSVKSQHPRLNIVASGSNYYTALTSGQMVYVFESPNSYNMGTLLTTWSLFDISGATGVEWYEDFDFIEVSGVLHFVFAVWDTTRWEFHHSEYTITTDSWVHNGSFYNSATDDHTGTNDAVVIVRTDGDLICIHRNTLTGWRYSIDTGTGFGSSTALDTSGSEGALAVDTNDVHFILSQTTTLYHWHLSPTDVLGAKQTASNMLENSPVAGQTKPLVYSGDMYVSSVNWAGASNDLTLYVSDAATGSDAPTWTKTQVTTTKLAGTGTGTLCWFVYGLNGVPTFVYVEQNTWKIYKTHLDGGSWTEVDTGAVLDVETADIDTTSNPDALRVSGHSAGLDSVNSDNFYTGWWKRAKIDTAAGVTDYMWHALTVNLNPTVFHTTDAVITELTQSEFHTTDALLLKVETRTHTTDAVLADIAQVGITHTTDALLLKVETRTHTTDAVLVVRTTVSHTTDAWIVYPPYDLSTTMTATSDILEGLTDREMAPATGLGVVQRRGGQSTDSFAPKTYDPKRDFTRRT